MAYSLPTRNLSVGKDLVAPTGLINFPAELQIVENSRCQDLLRQFGGGTATLNGSAAGNWGRLMEVLKNDNSSLIMRTLFTLLTFLATTADDSVTKC